MLLWQVKNRYFILYISYKVHMFITNTVYIIFIVRILFSLVEHVQDLLLYMRLL